MPWKWNMIFLDFLRISGTENTTGGASTWPRGWRARPTPLGAPPCLVGPQWPSSTYSCTHTLLLPPTNTNNQLKPESKLVLLPFSISLLKAPLTKLLGEIVPWYGDSSIGPISFCSSALFIANLCCLGDPVLEFACQIYMVKSSFDAWYRPYALVGVVAINIIEFDLLLFWSY